MPKKDIDRAPEYSWLFSDWSMCSVTCGGGTQMAHAVCHESRSGVVEEKFCNRTNKPKHVIQDCNVEPCPAR